MKMATSLDLTHAKTYVPDEASSRQSAALIRAMDEGDSPSTSVLVTAEGTRVELTATLAELLRQAADAFAEGNGISITSLGSHLSMIEAADLLGGQPIHVERLVDQGVLKMADPKTEQPFLLLDLIDYLNRQKQITRESLDEMAIAAEEDGLHEFLDKLPPRTR